MRFFLPGLAIYSTFLQRPTIASTTTSVCRICRDFLHGPPGFAQRRPDAPWVVRHRLPALPAQRDCQAPKDEDELADMMFTATHQQHPPSSVSARRGRRVPIKDSRNCRIGKAEVIQTFRATANEVVASGSTRGNELMGPWHTGVVTPQLNNSQHG